MTGLYRVERQENRAIYYCPHLPISMTYLNRSWKELLAELSITANINLDKNYGKNDAEALELAEKIMQLSYPGPYTLIWDYNVDKMKFVYKLKFNEEKDETFWTLKNS